MFSIMTPKIISQAIKEELKNARKNHGESFHSAVKVFLHHFLPPLRKSGSLAGSAS